MRSAAFLALVALLGGCGERGATTTVQRLVTLARPSRVESWADPPALDSLREAKMLRRSSRAVARRVALDAPPDERLAVLGPPGSSHRFAVRVPPRASLTFSVGALAATGAGHPVTAEVWIAGSGGRRRLLARSLDPATNGWTSERIDLGPWAGHTVELTLRTETRSDGSWLAWAAPTVQTQNPASGAWNVLLISLDTLRADHLGCYGYARPTSPRLDAFAAAAFRFAEAVSPAPWTHPAHRALFSGLYPKSDGGHRRRPLAEALWEAGYRTSAVTGGGQMDYRLGLARGFESYREEDWIARPGRVSDEIAAAASEARPFFFFLHSYEPHDPYLDTRFARDLPSGRLAGSFSHGMWRIMDRQLTDDEKRYVEALYDGDIAFTDAQLGRLLAGLAARGVLERTLVVITSDHGEQFWEHGTWRHGQNLYDHQLLVPLIISVPDALRQALDLPAASGVITQPVRLIDVYPTVLDLLGLEIEHESQGRSLVPLLAGEELAAVDILAEDLNLDDQESKALRFRGQKYISRIHADGRETTELYDLSVDPGEQRNLVDQRPRDAAGMRRRLHRLVGEQWWSTESKGTVGRDLPDDLRQRLEALGYLGR